ncbi:MAG: HAMP domain-containing histidine kinase, partial [Alphaproteobacteria bacterium]|nr:HAMP domain-containing histidine kinase [Alphaproteobacteria bacterium]
LVLYGGMAGRFRSLWKNAWGLAAHSLSGRLLLLTLLFVMVTEAVIFFPSIGRYHRSLLESHIESAEIAILPFTEAGGEELSGHLRRELLARAGASAVMLKRPEQRELFLVTVMPPHIDLAIDIRERNLFAETYQAVDCLINGGKRVLHVIAPTRIKGAETVEVIVGEKSIRDALVLYSYRILQLALLLSAVTALLVFASLYLVFVRPMRKITRAMIRFRDNPEDPGRIIEASSRKDEIGISERELGAMQRDIYGFLQQKARLAALGGAVARIQHDLRNMLASAQLASDRLAGVDDPVVQRLAPRLMTSLNHAVALATRTLRYGRADESPPQRQTLALRAVAEEAGEAALAIAEDKRIALDNAIAPGIEIDADPEQLYRILLNILRNAAEAVASGGSIAIAAARNGMRVSIDIADDGAGVPEAVAEQLFQPFASAARPGGTGLGLAIARDLARAHGGDIVLIETGPNGTRFRIEIPDREGY